MDGERNVLGDHTDQGGIPLIVFELSDQHVEAQAYEESEEEKYCGHHGVCPIAKKPELKVELTKNLIPVHYEYRDINLHQVET